MKVRQDFVTNSSSSSFIIAMKKTTQQPSVDDLLELFKVPKESPMYKISKSVAEVLHDRMEETTLDKLLYCWCCKSIEELPPIYQRAINEGKVLFTGLVSNDEDAFETCLCDIGIDYEDENIIISKEEGY